MEKMEFNNNHKIVKKHIIFYIAISINNFQINLKIPLCILKLISSVAAIMP